MTQEIEKITMIFEAPCQDSEPKTKYIYYNTIFSHPGGASGKESPCQCRRYEMQVQSLGGEDPLR